MMWRMLIIFCCILLSVELALANELGFARPSSTATFKDNGFSVFKLVFALLLVVGAIFATAWFYKRFGQVASLPNNAIRIVGGVSLGQRERIVVLQVGEEQLLLGVTPSRIDTLHKLEKPIEISSHTPTSDLFAEKFQSALKQWKLRKS
ncbi:MAG: flagellar biosynthetic protein FliO [Gammaproteobacteria bacterium]|nr:flagellar biosynthetic protein FliO [Gammaproteobacteria bacterium]